MNQKILEITEKLYQEGVEKGEQKAQEILIAAEVALLQWQKQGLGEMELLLPEQQKESLEAAFKTDAQTFLRDRCTFRFSDQIQTGFQVVFRAGKYKISFTDDDF